MDDELAIITPLDQSLQVEYGDVLEVVEEEINAAIKHKDFEEALTVCAKFINVIKVSGLALAKIFYLLHSAWPEFEIQDDFYDAVSSYLGLARLTVVNYTRVYTMLIHFVPIELKEEIMQKPIMVLVPIANALDQGYEIDEEEWKKLAAAPDYRTAGTLVREEVKEKEPRKSSLSILMDRDGSLWAWKDGESKFVGSLEVNDEDDVVQRAVNRIIHNSGIMRK
jgi:hypothetical protein